MMTLTRSLLENRDGPAVEAAALHRCEASHAEFCRLMDINAFRLSLFVPDMVPPLRRWHATISGHEVFTSGREAIGAAIREVAATIDNEREVRRWSYVDP